MRNADDARKPPRDAVLVRMGRPAWAWEWLRHNGSYRAGKDSDTGAFRRTTRRHSKLTVIEAKQAPPDRWGLCFAEDPDRAYQDAAVFWRPEIDASICPVAAVPPGNGDAAFFDLERLRVPATVLVLASGEQHLLLSDGFHAIQLHVVEGTLLNGPVRLAYVLEDFRRLYDHTLTIERLGIVLEKGKFPAGLFPPEPNAARWLLTLKAIELEAAGLSHADIAAQLYDGGGRTGFSTDWRRSRVRRLLETGHALIQRDYLKLLMRPAKAGHQAA